MKTKEIINQLRVLESQHIKNPSSTFNVDWSKICHMAVDKLESQQQEIEKYNKIINEVHNIHTLEEVRDNGNLLFGHTYTEESSGKDINMILIRYKDDFYIIKYHDDVCVAFNKMI